MNRLLFSRIAFLTPVLGLLSLPGCVKENHRLSIGRDEVHLEALEPEAAQATMPLELSQTPSEPLSIAPRGLERREWTGLAVNVPQDLTRHRPTYARRFFRLPQETARQRGEYPTPETALELEGEREGERMLDALVFQPLNVAGDTILLVPRMVWFAPWKERGSVRESPRWGYERWVEEENPETVPATPPVPPQHGGSASVAAPVDSPPGASPPAEPPPASLPPQPAQAPTAPPEAPAPPAASDEMLPPVQPNGSGGSSGSTSGGSSGGGA
ncbi:MAG: hypothetical protein SFZ23_04900 [Planctomycetota bacterium]|nr:hypothetical protein [Planctomycetota bacterium]